jgi:hypothetical protein
MIVLSIRDGGLQDFTNILCNALFRELQIDQARRSTFTTDRLPPADLISAGLCARIYP